MNRLFLHNITANLSNMHGRFKKYGSKGAKKTKMNKVQVQIVCFSLIFKS